MNRAACVVLCLFATSAAAAGWTHVGRIEAPCCFSGSPDGMKFGTAIAADLDTSSPPKIRALYVGAPGFSINDGATVYPEAGIVFVFVPVDGNWQVTTYLQPAFPQAYGHFGAAVAVDSGVVAIGEPGYDNGAHADAGRITLLNDRNRNLPTYTPPQFDGLYFWDSTVDNGRFGSSVAVAGDGIGTNGTGNWIAGGAPGSSTGCSALIYFGDDQSWDDKGSVCGATAGDTFGASVGVYSFGANDMLMAVGAPGEGITTGGAHVYHLSGGALANLSNLQAEHPGQFGFFGTSIAIDGQRLYVGATGGDKPGTGRTGSVTLFNPGGPNHYTLDGEVFPGSDAQAGDLCGASIHVNPIGTDFAMGCPGSDAQSNGEGFARVVTPIPFLGGTLWIDQALQMGSLPHGADDMGRGVAVVGDHVFAGAPLADDALGSDNGIVQIFGPDELFANGFD
ncbi:hypothetical protein FHW12_000589 [Dokdonella fugitiva]|uniref:FG-GAP repeat protein n=1 Tax=Dokdonella fugitiva TaxID=328517 RepID=A0A839EYX3_9GAMM|nr:hypothetical protein [Dokdonella fugitiva]MBA8886398.1 hypothetical protein [Dokdonella fugitiva]